MVCNPKLPLSPSKSLKSLKVVPPAPILFFKTSTIAILSFFNSFFFIVLARTIKKNELKKLKIAIVDVLKKSIGAGGTTFSDFRDLEGDNGNFGLQTNVYRRTGKQCRKCKHIIERQKIAGRSTHWCRKCQK